MTQPLWETIFADLDDLDTASDPVVRLNFAHLSTIMPMLRALGVYKDVGLKSRDWPARERLWKTSTIGAFASNLAVFMFQCNQTSADDSNRKEAEETNSIEEEDALGEDSTAEDSSSEEESSESEEEDSSEEVSSREDSTIEDEREEDLGKPSWKVVVVHQERPLALDVCGGVTLCPLHTFLQVVNVTSDRGTLHYHVATIGVQTDASSVQPHTVLTTMLQQLQHTQPIAQCPCPHTSFIIPSQMEV